MGNYNGLQSMSAFGDTPGLSDKSSAISFEARFPEENRRVSEVMHIYETDLLVSNGSESKIAEANRKRQAGLKDAADAILKRDRELRVKFPFTLGDYKERLKNNASYYLHEGILEEGQSVLECQICGKSAGHNDIFVIDDVSGVATCIDCANPDVKIDGKKFTLQWFV